MNNEYINPLKDIVFKYIFGREETKDCLLSFINAVLADTDMPELTDLELLNPFNLKEFGDDKLSILDIKAESSDGEIYNIEVQLSGNEDYRYRSLYYWAKLYSSQLTESLFYDELKPVICINILDFNLIKESKSFHTCFLPYECRNKELLLTEHFQLHFLELPKFMENDNEIDENLKEWFEFLVFEGKEDAKVKGVLDRKKEIKKAHQQYEKFTQDDKMRELYEARLKQRRDEASLIKHAKIEGKMEDAKKMLEKGLEISLIAEITDLPEKEILKLKQK